MNYHELADQLWEAEENRTQIQRLTDRFPEMTVADAYRIQLVNVERRLKNGQRLIGMKIGLTSQGMQKLLNVDVPDYGHLFDGMLLTDGQVCHISQLIQPKVEGELSFCLSKTLKGPGVTVADVYDAVRYVAPSIEIVDSRIQDWKVKLQDTVADNGSSARLMMGARMTPIEQVDMRLTGMTLEKNGELVNSGTTAEVWGNPAAAVACLANMLAEFGIELKAGSVVMAGALTAAVPVEAGDVVTASFQGMGSVTVKFVE
ncbi:2-keto-4-pentenoate hydratase [Oscillibacter sp. 1-3]|uniref:2-keto-4-pentenoate hydratase n=1 Tax=Oscillibacter sp. 1-3 TaxID=1235797 RepID=UPI00033D20A8|nr:fumarylacetoacetate hydrolase family protein [Oscillibacter sp. 1-3]EOS65473.1 2-oxopent-4-enoate hydratase [Oscillibacter sp. 1-3]